MDYTNLTDADLDAAYAAVYDTQAQTGDSATLYGLGGEIITRLATGVSGVWSYLSGVFGNNRFPLYTARTGFSQSSAARTATSASVQQVSTTAVNAVSGTVSTVSGLVNNLPLIIGGLVVLVILVEFGGKK